MKKYKHHMRFIVSMETYQKVEAKFDFLKTDLKLIWGGQAYNN